MLAPMTPPRSALALLLASAALLAGCGGDSGGSSGSGEPDTRAIELPASLGSFKDIVDVMKSKGAPSLDEQQKHQDTVRTATVDQYSKAYDGAAVANREYSDTDLLKTPYVIAVRAATPGLTLGPVIDAPFLKLAKPEHEVKTIGDVQCELFWETVIEGQTAKDSDEHVLRCQRTGSGLTVFAGGSGFDGATGELQLVGLVNEAWDAVSS